MDSGRVPGRGRIPWTPEVARPMGREWASWPGTAPEAPSLDDGVSPSSALTNCAEISSSSSRRLIAASPLERIASNSRSRLFLTMPSRVASTR